MRMLSALKKTVTAIAVSGLAASALSGQALAQDKEVFKWKVQSHWPSASSSYEDSLMLLKKRLEERTNGRLILQPFEAGALFPAKETFNAVSRGVIPMGTISPAYVRDKISVAGIASGLPFAFRNVWEAAYFHKHMGFEQMIREEAAEYGVYYSTDKVYPTELVVKDPIESWEDFQEMKLRSSGTLQKFLTEAGAAASYLPGGELYPALSSGVVDGAHWGAAQGAMSMSLYEIAKYHVKPPLNIAGTDAFIINQEAMNELPADIRETLIQTLDEQFWYRTNEYLYKERVTLAKAMKTMDVKINHLPQEVQNKLAETAQQMWAEEAKRSDRAAKAVKMLKDFLGELGYL